MGLYLARRLVTLPILLLGISLCSFGLMNLAPGDPAEMLLRAQQPGVEPPRAAVLALRRELGLDAPLAQRYLSWLGNILRADLGLSYRTGRSISTELLQRLPATLLLVGVSLVLAVVFGVPLGVIAACRHNRWPDHLSRLVGLVGATVPSYVVAIILIVTFAVNLRWLPAIGYGEGRHLVLPAIALALGIGAQLLRLSRACLLEVLGQDYVRTARAKGVGEGMVVMLHAMKNASLPVVAMLGVSLGHLLGGAVIVETIFGWPGVGKYAIDAVFLRDYPVVQGFVLYLTSIFVAINLVIDIVARWMDPRLHFGGVGS